jgi:hypothetical protein
MPTLTGVPATTRRGSPTRNEATVGWAATRVLAVPDTGVSLSDLTVTDCWPAVSRRTWNDARPLRNVTSIIGRSAAGSLLVTVADPLNDRSCFPAASTATAVTLIGTPART